MTKIYHKIYKTNKSNADYCVFVSGSGEGIWCFERYVEQFTNAGFNVVLIDNPGIGDAPEQESVIPAQHAVNIQKMLENEGIEQFHLLGHSHGGFVIQHMANNKPEAIKNLIMLSTGVGSFNHIRTVNFQLELTQSFIDAWHLDPENKEQSRRTAFAQLVGTKDKEDDFPYFFEKLIADRLALSPITRFSYILGGSQFSSISFLDTIKTRTLIIHGNEDKILEPSNALLTHALMQNSRLLMCDKVGHYPFVEDHSIWPAIINFIKGKQVGEKLTNKIDKNDLLVKDKAFLTAVKNVDKLKELLASVFRTSEKSLDERKKIFSDFISNK